MKTIRYYFIQPYKARLIADGLLILCEIISDFLVKSESPSFEFNTFSIFMLVEY